MPKTGLKSAKTQGNPLQSAGVLRLCAASVRFSRPALGLRAEQPRAVISGARTDAAGEVFS